MKVSKVLILAVFLLGITACDSDDNDNSAVESDQATGPTMQSYNELVTDLFENQTSATSDPLELNDLTFEFNNEDEHAFDGI